MRLLEAHQLGAARPSPALSYVRDCIGERSREAVRNVATRLKLLETASHGFPVSVNDGSEREVNSYVVSPASAYGDYARHEIGRLPQRWLARPLDVLARGVGARLRAAAADRVVHVNNWLLSTNLYPPDWAGHDLAQITELLVDLHPDHVVCWRSLNRFSNAALIDRLLALGYLAVPSRQVWLFDGRAGGAAHFLQRHNTRVDGTLRRRTAYEAVPGEGLADEDFERLEQLYNLLYLDKYCELNPQFTSHWLRRGHRDGWLRLQALRSPEGCIDGVLAFVGDERLITAPVVGYDTALPRRLGLYRLITRSCLEEAARERKVLNFSSGAGHFKRLRGGRPEIEYSLVHVRHLPAPRRRAWALLQHVLGHVGVPVMRRLQL